MEGWEFKACHVVGLYGRYGRKVIIACFVSAVLASVGFPQVFAASDALSSSSMDKAAMFILKDVLEVNLSRYHFDVRYTPIGTYLGLPEESVIYTHESGGEIAEFCFTFTDGKLRSINALVTGGLRPLFFVESELDAAKRFLEKCGAQLGAEHFKLMRSMLDHVKPKENVTLFSGNLKFTAQHGKVRSLDRGVEVILDFTEYRWTYVANGAEAPLKCVAIYFEQGLLGYFIDMWDIYRIGSEKIEISREKAVEIAMEEAQRAYFRVYSGNETWIEVSGFRAIGVNWTSLMFTNHPSSVGARGSDPLTLYPIWRVNVYFDRLYPGNIYGASVAMWADTGELCEIQPLYIMGSLFNNEAVKSEPPPQTASTMK